MKDTLALWPFSAFPVSPDKALDARKMAPDPAQRPISIGFRFHALRLWWRRIGWMRRERPETTAKRRPYGNAASAVLSGGLRGAQFHPSGREVSCRAALAHP